MTDQNLCAGNFNEQVTDQNLCAGNLNEQMTGQNLCAGILNEQMTDQNLCTANWFYDLTDRKSVLRIKSDGINVFGMSKSLRIKSVLKRLLIFI